MYIDDIKKLTVPLTPWDEVNLMHPNVVPIWTRGRELLAVNLDELPLADDLKWLVRKYQGVDLRRLEWLDNRSRKWSKPLELECLGGKAIDFKTGEVVTEKTGRHATMTEVPRGYRLTHAGGETIYWHQIMELEYQRRIAPWKYGTVIEPGTGRYDRKKWQIHHRYEPLNGTSMGNRLLSVRLIPYNEHAKLHTIMGAIQRSLEDGFLKARATVKIAPAQLDQARKELLSDPQLSKEEAKKGVLYTKTWKE